MKFEDKGKWGVAHIFSTVNTTIVHVTDITGSETIARYSSGMMTDKDREQGMPFPAMLAARKAAEEALAKGLTGVHIRVRARGGHHNQSPGAGAQLIFQGLTSNQSSCPCRFAYWNYRGRHSHPA